MQNNLIKRANLVYGMLIRLEKELFTMNKGKAAIIVSEAMMVIDEQRKRIKELEQELRDLDRAEE